MFVTLAVLAWRFVHRLRNGDIFAGYLIGYGSGRFWIEWFFRPDAWRIGALAAAQWVGLALILFGLAIILVPRLVARRQPPATIS